MPTGTWMTSTAVEIQVWKIAWDMAETQSCSRVSNPVFFFTNVHHISKGKPTVYLVPIDIMSYGGNQRTHTTSFSWLSIIIEDGHLKKMAQKSCEHLHNRMMKVPSIWDRQYSPFLKFLVDRQAASDLCEVIFELSVTGCIHLTLQSC